MDSTEQDTDTGMSLGTRLIDRRAQRLVRLINADFHPEELLTTKETAAWLSVSTQFLEIGRTRGYGPKFKLITDSVVRYRVGDIRDWLKVRTYASTAEYKTIRRRRKKKTSGLRPKGAR
jgi:hypothetical protein